MLTYQGLVARLTAEGMAEIVITPGQQSIPGAPEVSEKVCHTCTDGSTVRIEAINRAGAEAGDWVSLSRPSDTLKKNVTALLGMPLLGAIIGGGVGLVLMFGMGLPVAAVSFCAAIGVVLGIVAGSKRYRILSEHNQPVISRIVKKRSELAATWKDNPKAAEKGDMACDLCSGCAVR